MSATITPLHAEPEHPAASDHVTVTIAGQMFGIQVLQVRDVLGPQRLTRVPLAPPEVAGSLNLRGRIVTAIDVRTRLSLPPAESGIRSMSVVVDVNGELYSLMVDAVGEVLNLPKAAFEANPSTLDARWRAVSKGIYRLDGKLLVVLDIAALLNILPERVAYTRGKTDEDLPHC